MRALGVMLPPPLPVLVAALLLLLLPTDGFGKNTRLKRFWLSADAFESGISAEKLREAGVGSSDRQSSPTESGKYLLGR